MTVSAIGSANPRVTAILQQAQQAVAGIPPFALSVCCDNNGYDPDTLIRLLKSRTEASSAYATQTREYALWRLRQMARVMGWPLQGFEELTQELSNFRKKKPGTAQITQPAAVRKCLTDIALLQNPASAPRASFETALRRVLGVVEIIRHYLKSDPQDLAYARHPRPGLVAEMEDIYRDGMPADFRLRAYPPPGKSFHYQPRGLIDSRAITLTRQLQEQIPENVGWEVSKEDLMRSRPDPDLLDLASLANAEDFARGIEGAIVVSMDILELFSRFPKACREPGRFQNALAPLGKRGMRGSPALGVVLAVAPYENIFMDRRRSGPQDGWIPLLGDWLGIVGDNAGNIVQLAAWLEDGTSILIFLAPTLKEALIQQAHGKGSMFYYPVKGHSSRDTAMKLRGDGFGLLGINTEPTVLGDMNATLHPSPWEVHDDIHNGLAAGLAMDLRRASPFIYREAGEKLRESAWKEPLLDGLADMNVFGFSSDKSPARFATHHVIARIQKLMRYGTDRKEILAQLHSVLSFFKEYELLLTRLAHREPSLKGNFGEFLADADSIQRGLRAEFLGHRDLKI